MLCHSINQSPRDSGLGTRTNGDHAFFRSSLCQNRRPSWGKSKWKRFIMAFTLYSDGAHAKARDGLGKIRFETRLSWRFRKKKRRSRQSRRLMGGLGKIEWEPVYLGDCLKKKRRLRQNRRPSNGLGKFPAEAVYFGDRQETRDRIGETRRVSQTRRGGPCRRRRSGSDAATEGRRPERPGADGDIPTATAGRRDRTSLPSLRQTSQNHKPCRTPQ